MTADAAARARSARNELVDDSRSRGADTVGESTHPRLIYRPELDGIRGLAILLVLAAHAAYPFLLEAGQVGVTLFFVLSGYLITGLLRAELERTGRVDLRAFYVRRARRLLPALAVLLLVAAIVGWAALPAIATIALYVGNWFRDGVGFIGHTWSLAIEEQFYLVWPLLFIAGLRSPRILLVLAAGSAVLRLTTGGDWSVSTFVRLDGLLVGAALALTSWSAPRWAGAVGLGWMTIAVVLPFGWSVTLATAGGSLLVASSPSWIASRPLVWLGGISYALYLWHFPLIYATGWPLWVSVPTSIAVAWASTRFLEAPFRRLRRANAVLEAVDDVERAGRPGLRPSHVDLHLDGAAVHQGVDGLRVSPPGGARP